MNLTELREHEARRRLKLLGTTIDSPGGSALRTRARQVSLPLAVLAQWHARYLHGGIDALYPDWSDCDFAAYCGKIERHMLHKESGTICFTKKFGVEMGIFHHLNWPVESIHAKTSPLSAIF